MASKWLPSWDHSRSLQNKDKNDAITNSYTIWIYFICCVAICTRPLSAWTGWLWWVCSWARWVARRKVRCSLASTRCFCFFLRNISIKFSLFNQFVYASFVCYACKSSRNLSKLGNDWSTNVSSSLSFFKLCLLLILGSLSISDQESKWARETERWNRANHVIY